MKKSGVILILVLCLVLAGSIILQLSDAFSEPTANKMKLYTAGKDAMPAPDKILSNSVNVFTVLLFEDGKVYSYYGNKVNEGVQSKLSDGSFQKLLLEAKEKYKEQLQVYLKPSEAANYQSTVDLLDQMTINNISKYAMVDLSVFDKKIIDSVFK